jgi:hypothetical protein
VTPCAAAPARSRILPDISTCHSFLLPATGYCASAFDDIPHQPPLIVASSLSRVAAAEGLPNICCFCFPQPQHTADVHNPRGRRTQHYKQPRIDNHRFASITNRESTTIGSHP